MPPFYVLLQRSVYIQAALPRDTEKMYTSFQDAITVSEAMLEIVSCFIVVYQMKSGDNRTL